MVAIEGLVVKDNKSGFKAVRLHYTADPVKRSLEWVGKAKAGMPSWAWAREYEIDFSARGGKLIYDMWDANIHEVVLGDIPDTWTRYRCVDQGLANPTVCDWAAVNPQGDVHFYREYYQAEQTIAENCQNIVALTSKENIYVSYGDPSIFQRDPKDGKMLADEYAMNGVTLTPGNNSVPKGIDAVCRYLICTLAKWCRENDRTHPYFEGWDAKKTDALANQPGVYFSRACVNTIREHTHWRWGETSNPQDHNVTEKPVDKDDHTCDAVRYLLCASPGYRDPSPGVQRYERKSMMRRAAY